MDSWFISSKQRAVVGLQFIMAILVIVVGMMMISFAGYSAGTPCGFGVAHAQSTCDQGAAGSFANTVSMRFGTPYSVFFDGAPTATQTHTLKDVVGGATVVVEEADANFDAGVGVYFDGGTDDYLTSPSDGIIDLFAGTTTNYSVRFEDNQITVGSATNGTVQADYNLVIGADPFSSQASSEVRINIDGAQQAYFGVGELAVGISNADGVFHAYSGNASQTADSNADEGVFEGSGNAGISILSGASSYGNIFFGDSGGDNVGVIRYDHNNDRTEFLVTGQVPLVVGPGVSYFSDNQALIVGHTSQESIGTAGSSELQVMGTGGGDSGVGLVRWSNDVGGASITVGKSRGTSIGTHGVVQNGDPLGRIDFTGDDGADLNATGAQILVEVDGTPGSNDMPTRIILGTAADGANSVTEALRIDSSQVVQISQGVGYGKTDGVLDLTADTSVRILIDADNDDSSKTFSIYENSISGTPLMSVEEGGIVYIGDSANANMKVGLTVNQGAQDNEILTLKSSDVGHGITSIAETDTFGKLEKASPIAGGLLIQAYTDPDLATGGRSLLLHGVVGEAVDTSTDSSSTAAVEVTAYKKNGTTVQALGSTENIFNVTNAGTNHFVIKGNGDSWQDGVAAFYETTDPSTATNVAHIYAKNGTHGAEIWAQDEAGNASELSSHKGDVWHYNSGNKFSGKQTQIDMEALALAVEALCACDLATITYTTPELTWEGEQARFDAERKAEQARWDADRTRLTAAQAQWDADVADLPRAQALWDQAVNDYLDSLNVWRIIASDPEVLDPGPEPSRPEIGDRPALEALGERPGDELLGERPADYVPEAKPQWLIDRLATLTR